MKVLVVCSFNKGFISPFIIEQVEYLKKSGVKIDYSLIKGKGILGYLRNLKVINKQVEISKPDLIHAHYGFSGLLANLQRKIPVVTTFHGSDINILRNRLLSGLASSLSKQCIYVSNNLAEKSLYKGNFSVISSGVDLEQFFPIDKKDAREKLGLSLEDRIVLFSSSFGNKVKNFPLANMAIKLLKNVRLVELSGYDRNDVNLLLNACDAALLTSFHEGSPQFIKEAMACNRPIVSVDVGDVKGIIGSTEGCFCVTASNYDISDKIRLSLEYPSTINGRPRIRELGLDIETTTERLLNVYKKVLKK